MPHVGKAPLTVVRLSNGSRVNVHRGVPVPGSADPKDVKRLTDEGYLAKLSGPKPAVQPAAPAAPAEGTVEDVLAAVGDDPAKAAAALEVEKAGKNRTTLVSKLEAIVAADSGDDGDADAGDGNGSDNGDGDAS